MATVAKNYLDLTGLQAYDTLIKAWANSENQIAYKTVAKSADGNSILFFKKPSAVVGTDTADETISLGNSDMQTQLNALASVCGATWDSTNHTYSLPLDSTFGANTDTVVEALNELKGQINILNGSDSTSGSVAKSIKDAVEALDTTSDVTIASQSGNAVTIVAGISETDGVIGAGSGTAITLADVAATGAADDVDYDNTTSGLTATNAQDALDELAAASAGGVASKTVYITETTGQSTDAFSKRYGVYQGANGSASSPVAGEKLVDIDIPKDMVVEDGSVVDITFSNGHLYDGVTDVTEIIKGAGGTATAADAGKYIKLEIANAASSVLYIAAKDLVDIYTAQQNATQVQLVIDNNNEISATIVAGSIGSTELASNAVITAKIADDAVTADKVSIAAHSETQTAGTDGLALSVTTTDGQVSAVSGSIAANTYDAYGAATAAVNALDTTSDVAIASVSGDVITLQNGIKQEDGLIAQGTGDGITISPIATASINALFS